jgi:putative aldouronate transport system substrate-binding protein
MIRMDWLDKLGLKVPVTMDEFREVARAFTLKDPDGNGKNDTYGITSPRGSMMYNLFGYDIEGWMVEDGKWIPAIVSKRTPANIAFVQKMDREGLWDREFSLNGWRQAVQKFSQGTFGMLLRNADVYWINRVIVKFFGPANPSIPDPLSAVGLMGPFTVEGRKAGWPQKNETCGTEISAKVDDKKLDRILMLTEYLMSPAAKTVAHFGIEGEDYTVVDGKPQPKIDPATKAPISISSKYPSFSIFTFSDWDFDWDIAEPGNVSISPAIKKLAAENRGRYNAAAMPENLAVRLLSTPAKDELTVFGTWRESFDQIVQGKEEAAAAWKKFVDENMAKGLAKAIDEVNAAVKQKGIKP